MKAPQPSLEPRPEASATAPTEGESPPSPPPPEPWTPERVVAWNAYYDLYVALGALLLGFLTSAVKVANSSIWADLRAGRLILARGPLARDVLSFTAEGGRWVDVSWLYQAANALLYQLGATFFSSDAARADRVGVIAVVAANAAVRMLTVLTLLGLRRQGPGLWWVAACATLGIAAIAPAPLGPETWGLLLLALEILLLHRAIDLGSKGAGWALVPLFALWANIDASFLVGLILLGAAAIAGGTGPVDLKGEDHASRGWARSRGLALLAACAAACLLNPSHVLIFPEALGATFGDFAFLFGKVIQSRARGIGPAPTLVLVGGLYVALVAAGAVSFRLNRRRPARARLAMFGVAALLLLGSFASMVGVFAVVLAATLATNGQEWYLGRFGAAGRLGKGWAVWSVGGRLVTIAGTFLLIGLALTGYASRPGDPVFGFGYDPDDFALEAAEFLREAPIKGKVLNASRSLGDALLWRAYPKRPTYIDSRRGVFPAAIDAEFREVREALRDGKEDAWRPILDRRGIDVVMINRHEGPGLRDPSPRTFETLLNSPKEWVHFYDDGNVAMFGRADADPEDLAYFRENRRDAEELAYKRTAPLRVTAENPSPTTGIDRYFRSKALATMQPHGRVAYEWLHPPGSEASDTPTLPDPAHCLVAIREARTSLAHKPDDNFAYRVLAEAYKYLLIQEASILSRSDGQPRPAWLAFRNQQRTTALNFALMTSTPPDGQEEREALIALNRELFGVYETIGAIDLARDRLAAIRALSLPGDFDPGEQKILSRLDEAIAETRRKMEDPGDAARPSPLYGFEVALRSGMMGVAIAELEDIEKRGVNPALVKARLVDLLCQVGQPDKAMEVLRQGDLNDPNLETEAGMSLYRHARVYLLMGQYEPATVILGQAIARIQALQTQRVLESFTQGTLQGDLKLTSRTGLELVRLVGNRASWEAELGLIDLEYGEPKLSAEGFERALSLEPKLDLRPLLAYYLKQMGRTVPEPPKPEGPAAAEPGKDPAPAAPAGELPQDPFAPAKP